MENILISACLLGYNTKYNGKNNYVKEVELLKEKYNLIPVCPEVDGGLSTPRNPSEINGDKVISNKGVDVTKEYNLGAKHALDVALKNNCHIAILKEKSPSCGKYFTYDGTFTSKIVNRSGVTAKLLMEHGIKIYDESEIKDLLNEKILKID